MSRAENTAAGDWAQWRGLSASAAIGSLGLTALLVVNYLGPTSLAALLVSAAAAASFAWPRAWLVVLPAALPILSFAPMTGSIVVEEFDLLALAAYAGAYARQAVSPPTTAYQSEDRIGPLAWSLVALLTASYAIAAWRGTTMSVTFTLLASDYSPSNNLRCLKGFLWALIALPLLNREFRRSGATALEMYARGVLLGLFAVSLASLWERLTFTELLDFASDYRITAAFWEMHVGGGALDGFLALTLPFACWRTLQAPHPWQRAASAALAGLSGYAVLVTFSRALYAACAVGVLVVAAGTLLIAHREPTGEGRLPSWIGVTLALLVGCLLIPVFAEGGYRVLAAVCIALGSAIIAGAIARDSLIRNARVAAITALVLIPTVIAIDSSVPKGAYFAFLVAQGVFVIAIAVHWLKKDGRSAGIAVGAFISSSIGAVLVAQYWNGFAAAGRTAIVMVVALGAAAYNASARRAIWTLTVSVVSTAALIGGVSAIAAVIVSSYAANARFATVGEDFDGRLAHWRRVVSLMPAPWNNWLGAGLGQLPTAYLMSGSGLEFPGTFRLMEEQDGPYIRLGLPASETGNSEPLLFQQRVTASAGDGPFTLSLQARAKGWALLTVGLCQRHLLYPSGCTASTVTLNSPDGTWQDVRVLMPEESVTNSPALLPRPIVFAMADASAGNTIDIRGVVIHTADGRSLLRNGDFSTGIAHWFFASDRIHLPWHAKNLWLGVWFDQGWLGVSLLLALVGIAIGRLIQAVKQGVPQAIPILAGLLAFLVVGLFDSLLNVPRIAFLAYLTLFASLPRVSPVARKRNLRGVS